MEIYDGLLEHKVGPHVTQFWTTESSQSELPAIMVPFFLCRRKLISWIEDISQLLGLAYTLLKSKVIVKNFPLLDPDGR